MSSGLPPFSQSAPYYELLYGDKDYALEAAFVFKTLRARRARIKSILELGCGPGHHAAELAGRGCSVLGVDGSSGMLARAKRRAARLEFGVQKRLSFLRGDIRRLRVARTFDAVISLFHVFSYLPEPEDLAAALATARVHLRPGGVLLFDCWYGPAVLSQGCGSRRKVVENGDCRIVRSARPRRDRRRNAVEVLYRYAVRRKSRGAARRFQESHRMRYWFRREVEDAERAAGLVPLEAFEWGTRRPLGARTWNACFLARRPRRA